METLYLIITIFALGLGLLCEPIPNKPVFPAQDSVSGDVVSHGLEVDRFTPVDQVLKSESVGVRGDSLPLLSSSV